MAGRTLWIAALASLALSGCIARTAADIITAPVKVVSKGVDLATTSQSEADEKRGRAIRQREERLGQLARRKEKFAKKCEKGKRKACAEVAAIDDETERLLNAPY